MAPVKINHIVSFSSQDPRYPVENLLHDDPLQPWLSCPQDRSRHLKVELQLERAAPIGYVDIGNHGSAFLQIEVGRSSWPLEQPYVTLVPTATLMTPTDAKLGKNRSGVRMFKEGDFLASARDEKWDRLRLTCSQPFNKHAQFGLSFLRIRTPPDVGDSQAAPDAEPAGSPWLSNPAFRRTFFPETQGARARRGLAGAEHPAAQLTSLLSPADESPLARGCFRADLLPAHASACGEDDFSMSATLSPSPPWEEPPEAWVPCPICQYRFSAAEVEAHASSCGEPDRTVAADLWLD
uniref:XRCC1 N-terminal domain containing 1, N-terminal like n=1 Tax=Sphenodon punctatus TaxID=8508 RepID=A0A8D0HPW5_SPHPU